MSDDLFELLLNAANSGDTAAQDTLFGQAHDEMLLGAQQLLLWERRDHELDAKKLVDKAYTTLYGSQGLTAQSRAYPTTRVEFFRFVQLAMQRVLVDYTRRRRSELLTGSL